MTVRTTGQYLPRFMVCVDSAIIGHILYFTLLCSRDGLLLQAHTLIGQGAQLSSSDWSRASDLYILSN